ncbi:MAG: hypothetical protein DIU68_007235 [Chloroflexota bacterium]|nr:MAG: hypothetical protein DIU68_19760 [Chloroflexota bacterium]
MRQIAAIIMLCLLLALSGAVAGQDRATWRVESVLALPLSTGVGSARIFPSPDGRRVVHDSSIRLNGHIDRYLTLTLSEPGDEPRYFERPEDLPRGFEADPASPHVPFRWSPDSARIAVASQPFATLLDTDLWIFDLESEQFTNLTDDGYTGPLTRQDGATPAPGTTMELNPTWSPDGARIAVEQSVIGEDGTFQPAEIVLIDSASGEAQPLLAVPGNGAAGATTSMDWSPDGATLALTVLHREADAENDGLWLVDTEAGEPRLLATLEQIDAAARSIFADVSLTAIGPVMWSPDGTRLLLWAGDSGGTPARVWPFVVDAGDGELTPVALPAHPNDTPERRALRPLQAAWSPDGRSLLLFTFGLHPDEENTPLDPDNTSVRGAVRVIDVTSGEGQILGHLPLGKATPLYYAAWGPDGDVIVNSYHLKLAEE